MESDIEDYYIYNTFKNENNEVANNIEIDVNEEGEVVFCGKSEKESYCIFDYSMCKDICKDEVQKSSHEPAEIKKINQENDDNSNPFVILSKSNISSFEMIENEEKKIGSCASLYVVDYVDWLNVGTSSCKNQELQHIKDNIEYEVNKLIPTFSSESPIAQSIKKYSIETIENKEIDKQDEKLESISLRDFSLCQSFALNPEEKNESITNEQKDQGIFLSNFSYNNNAKSIQINDYSSYKYEDNLIPDVRCITSNATNAKNEHTKNSISVCENQASVLIELSKLFQNTHDEKSECIESIKQVSIKLEENRTQKSFVEEDSISENSAKDGLIEESDEGLEKIQNNIENYDIENLAIKESLERKFDVSADVVSPEQNIRPLIINEEPIMDEYLLFASDQPMDMDDGLIMNKPSNRPLMNQQVLMEESIIINDNDIVQNIYKEEWTSEKLDVDELIAEEISIDEKNTEEKGVEEKSLVEIEKKDNYLINKESVENDLEFLTSEKYSNTVEHSNVAKDTIPNKQNPNNGKSTRDIINIRDGVDSIDSELSEQIATAWQHVAKQHINKNTEEIDLEWYKNINKNVVFGYYMPYHDVSENEYVFKNKNEDLSSEESSLIQRESNANLVVSDNKEQDEIHNKFLFEDDEYLEKSKYLGFYTRRRLGV